MKNQKLKLIKHLNVHNDLRHDLGLMDCDWAWGVGLKCWHPMTCLALTSRPPGLERTQCWVRDDKKVDYLWVNGGQPHRESP